ncbi:MAG TPA: TIGR02147 family protein [Bdellovibrio sp.]|nr:TIGR02147 family protein [Bdellovibrio sp.]
MEKVFNYKSYRNYLKDYIAIQGQGIKKAISLAINVSPSLLSQVLAGDRDLTPEQCFRFSNYMDFNSSEKAYWLLLLDYEKASSDELKKFIEGRLEEAQIDFNNNYRIRHGLTRAPWSDEFVAVFYSSWHFVVIYCIFAIQKGWSAEELSQRLHIPLSRTEHVLDFFLSYEVIQKMNDGKYQLRKSDFVQLGTDTLSHKSAVLHNNKNFRHKAIDVLEETQFIKNRDSFFSSICVAISEKDYHGFREDLKEVIDKLHKRIAAENFEQVVCLNIDYFRV